MKKKLTHNSRVFFSAPPSTKMALVEGTSIVDVAEIACLYTSGRNRSSNGTMTKGTTPPT
ncbi:hypothetical protein D3C80_1826430 [compost metagenome]